MITPPSQPASRRHQQPPDMAYSPSHLPLHLLQQTSSTGVFVGFNCGRWTRWRGSCDLDWVLDVEPSTLKEFKEMTTPKPASISPSLTTTRHGLLSLAPPTSPTPAHWFNGHFRRHSFNCGRWTRWRGSCDFDWVLDVEPATLKESEGMVHKDFAGSRIVPYLYSTDHP